MNDLAGERLREIVTSEGRGIVDEPRRLQALMLDRAGEYRLEVNLLGVALDEGVPEALLRNSQGGDPSGAVERLARRLEDSRGVAYDKAFWAVERWAYALGVPTGHSAQPLPATGVTPSLSAESFGPLLPTVSPASTRSPSARPNDWVKKPPFIIAVSVVVLIAGFVVFRPRPHKVIAAATTSTTLSPTTLLPTTTLNTTPVVNPTPSGDPFPTRAERDLLARVPTATQASCVRDPSPITRAVVALQCDPTSSIRVWYSQYSTEKEMDDELNSFISTLGTKEGTCDTSTVATFNAVYVYKGPNNVDKGRIVCYTDKDNVPRLEWTTSTTHIIAEALIRGGNTSTLRQSLMAFWTGAGPF